MSVRKIVCKITGKSYVFAKDYYQAKVQEYVDEENLLNYFITKKAKTLLNRGYSVQEIRNILNVDEEGLLESDSEEMNSVIEFHKGKNPNISKKISNTLNFAMYKSDPDVANFINTIRNYE